MNELVRRIRLKFTNVHIAVRAAIVFVKRSGFTTRAGDVSSKRDGTYAAAFIEVTDRLLRGTESHKGALSLGVIQGIEVTPTVELLIRNTACGW